MSMWWAFTPRDAFPAGKVVGFNHIGGVVNRAAHLLEELYVFRFKFPEEIAGGGQNQYRFVHGQQDPFRVIPLSTVSPVAPDLFPGVGGSILAPQNHPRLLHVIANHCVATQNAPFIAFSVFTVRLEGSIPVCEFALSAAFHYVPP